MLDRTSKILAAMCWQLILPVFETFININELERHTIREYGSIHIIYTTHELIGNNINLFIYFQI